MANGGFDWGFGMDEFVGIDDFDDLGDVGGDDFNEPVAPAAAAAVAAAPAPVPAAPAPGAAAQLMEQGGVGLFDCMCVHWEHW